MPSLRPDGTECAYLDARPGRSAARDSLMGSRHRGCLHGHLRVLTRGQHPLREGILATIQLPADLTKKEAKRLAVFIESLALEEPAQQLALPRGDVSAAYVGAEQLVIGHVQPGAGRRQTAGGRAVPL